MRSRFKTQGPTLAAVAILASLLIVGCSDSTSSKSFGNYNAPIDSNSEGEEEEGSGTGSEVEAPESVPTMGTRTLADDEFESKQFSLDSDSIVYTFINNPDQHDFDAWIMTEAELAEYQLAVDALPASSANTHQNYKANYGTDVTSSMINNVPTSVDLSAGDYYLVIDNTDLGNEDGAGEEISFQYAVFAGQTAVLISEDSE